MLPHLLQVLQALVLPLHDGAHPPHGSFLELLAAVQGIAILQQPHVVLRDVVDEMLGRVDLAQGELVVVLVVQDVHEVGVKRVDVVQLGELVQNARQLVVEVLLSEFHFFRVELPDPRYLVVLVDHSRSLPLGFGQNNVHEVFGRRDYCYFLKVVMRHCLLPM